MYSAVFVGVDGNVGVPPVGARVRVAGAQHTALAKGMLAAAGVKRAVIVTAGPADVRLLVSPPGERTPPTGERAMMPVPMRYNAAVLRALVVGADVSVGSVRRLLPGHEWLQDAGVEVVRVPSGAARVAELFADAVGRETSVRVEHDVARMPERSHGFGFGRRIALSSGRVRDVPLRDGDVVASPGQPWYYRDGALYTHRFLSMSSEDVRFNRDDVLTPRDPRAELTGCAVGDRIDLTMAWPNDGSTHRYEAVVVSTRAPWRLQVLLRPPIVLDTLGTCFGDRSATAERCLLGGNVWDRPCERDDECPYHDPRRGRGGCNAGMCEMPLNVANASFRVAAADTPAMFHTCPVSDAAYPFCSQEPLYQAVFEGETLTGARPT